MTPLAQELANEIFMSSSFAAHLVVEGTSDFAAFKQHRQTRSGLNIVPAHGKPIVLECMNIVEATKTNNTKYAGFHVHFFVDRDYTNPLNQAKESPVLTSTDERDFECQMLKSNAFDRVAFEVICEKRLRQGNISIFDFRDSLLNSASVIGATRFASAKSNESIDFKELQPNKFFDGKKLNLNTKQLATHLSGKNRGMNITEARILKDVQSAKNESYFSSPYLLCSGHDLILLMSAALKNWWKPKSLDTSVEPPTLEAMFRLAYGDIFRTAGCYKRIHVWLTQATGNANLLAPPIT